MPSARGRSGRCPIFGSLPSFFPWRSPAPPWGGRAAGPAGHAAATARLVLEGSSVGTWLRLALLLGAALIVERFPVPIKGASGGVSLAAVFIVATGCLYGWPAAAFVGFLTRGAVEAAQRRPLVRFAYNGSVYALSGAAAGVAAGVEARGAAVGWLLLQVLVGAAVFYAANIVLIAAAVATSSRQRFVDVLEHATASTAVAFAIMASVTVILDVLWQRSPVLAPALVGPLLAVSMYQRSVHRALEAMELALTDPLTGLGNHRHFQEELQRQLDRADEHATPLTLAMLDLDDFKTINDRHGHPVGDRALTVVGSCLGASGAGFRLGGDEFALLLPGLDETQGFATATCIVDRLAAVEAAPGLPIRVSAGVATYPAVDRSELVRLADQALYVAKGEGKGGVRAYRRDVIELATRIAREETDRRARLRAAASLATALEVRHQSVGSHSHAVGWIAARLATRLGLSPDEIELIRLAGSLHDLGKIAITEEIIGKPGPLDPAERALVRRHPRVAYRMLNTVGIEPVASWVLHAHEHWDGSGYPGRLAGEEIPLASRIVFVADAFDSMTRDRPYRRRIPEERALAEIVRCAGTQFDPDVVDALAAELADLEGALEGVG